MDARPAHAIHVIGVAALPQVSGSGCKEGGCYDHQQNFQIAPAESCIQSILDVCDATSGWLTLHNECAQPLIIEYGATDAGLANVTLAPGAEQQFSVAPFGLHGAIQVPALAGTTPIVIAYDVD